MSTIGLTQKQEEFALAYVETSNASEAYRRVYKPKTTNVDSIGRMAYAVLENVKVASRIQAIRDKAAKKVGITLEEHLASLEELKSKALERGQISAGVRAEELKAKASGLYVERVEYSGKIELQNLKDEQLARIVAGDDVDAALAGTSSSR